MCAQTKCFARCFCEAGIHKRVSLRVKINTKIQHLWSRRINEKMPEDLYMHSAKPSCRMRRVHVPIGGMICVLRTCFVILHAQTKKLYNIERMMIRHNRPMVPAAGVKKMQKGDTLHQHRCGRDCGLGCGWGRGCKGRGCRHTAGRVARHQRAE